MAAVSELKRRTTTSDNQGNNTTTLEYLVHGFAAGASDSTIASTTGLPTLNDMFAGSGGAINVKRTIVVDTDKSTTAAMVTTEYSTNPNAAGGNSQPDNNRDPTTDPAKIYAHPQFATKTGQFDFSTPKRAYKNSSGELLADPPQVDDPRTVVIYEKNTANFSSSLALNGSHGGKINESDFSITSQGYTHSFGAKTALFLGVALEPKFYTSATGVVTPYWTARFEFAHRGSPWNPRKVADYGFCELVPDVENGGLKQQPIGDLVPINAPVALDGNGHVADVNNPNFLPGTLTFNDYEMADFSALGLS